MNDSCSFESRSGTFNFPMFSIEVNFSVALNCPMTGWHQTISSLRGNELKCYLRFCLTFSVIAAINSGEIPSDKLGGVSRSAKVSGDPFEF